MRSQTAGLKIFFVAFLGFLTFIALMNGIFQDNPFWTAGALVFSFLPIWGFYYFSKTGQIKKFDLATRDDDKLGAKI